MLRFSVRSTFLAEETCCCDTTQVREKGNMMATHQSTEGTATGCQDESPAIQPSSTLAFFKTRTLHQTDRRRAASPIPDHDDFLLMRQVAARNPQAFETVYL